MEVKIQKLNAEQLKKMGVFSWPIWTKEVSSFPWSYDCVEECYFLEGEVSLQTQEGKTISFGQGDFVTFPKGLSCTWNVVKPVKKHYNFK
jgi:uncharacterized cupin superfamily protein